MADRRSGPLLGRRRLGCGALALGSGVLLASRKPFPAAGAAWSGDRAGAPVLHHGSARRARLLKPHLTRLVAEARTFLDPSPEHPWYAGAVLLAGRGGTVAVHRAIGKAVRYAAYDEEADTGVELPLGEQIAARPDTVWDLASVSKLFTALLAVQQIERGRLGLHTRVSTHLPGFGGAGKEDITLRQLLTHTSGLAAWLPLYAEPDRRARLQRLWEERPLDPPGTGYRYSDLNLIALQLVLERVTGRTLDVLLHEEITGPLGMVRTRYNPPASWKPQIAATEDARPPWSGLDRGLVWGQVHDENAHSFGGVAGHAGVFSCAWDLAVLCRTLLNGGGYGRVRILRPESVDLMFRNFNTAFPGDEHGLGFELYQHWYMGAMATPRTAGHTGFTGTSLVLDPGSDTFLILLGNAVHPVRNWRFGSAPRVAAGNRLARAVAVRPVAGRHAWFAGITDPVSATLSLPALSCDPGGRLRFCVWWDTGPVDDVLRLEVSLDGGVRWQPVPLRTRRPGQAPEEHPDGTLQGYSGRVWHRADAPLAFRRTGTLRLRWRYTADGRRVGRGVYLDRIRVDDGGRMLFDDARPHDARRITAEGWVRSAD